jgi:NAD(P)-dependent dehydrogenase (short-subunit alcohol dehydrogenase family)
MAGRLEGKVALVTGGASGIGAGCAERLAADGASVVITDLQTDKGQDLATKIGGATVFLRHDVTREDEWEGLIAGIKARVGRLDILVNNAGIGLGGSVLTMTLEDWRRQTAVNLDGVFLGTKHAIPLMRESGEGGSIINMSSVAGLKGAPTLAGYCATKGGVRLFTKAVALECAAAGDKIRVNSVHPGIIETPIWEGIASTALPGSNLGPGMAPDLDAMSAMAVPLAVKGYPADIAAAVSWLASDDSRYVTGAEIVVDGGLSVR